MKPAEDVSLCLGEGLVIPFALVVPGLSGCVIEPLMHRIGLQCLAYVEVAVTSSSLLGRVDGSRRLR